MHFFIAQRYVAKITGIRILEVVLKCRKGGFHDSILTLTSEGEHSPKGLDYFSIVQVLMDIVLRQRHIIEACKL